MTEPYCYSFAPGSCTHFRDCVHYHDHNIYTSNTGKKYRHTITDDLWYEGITEDYPVDIQKAYELECMLETYWF